MDETLCWTIYQARNWANWSRPMRFAITILPMVVFGIVAWKAFRPEGSWPPVTILWRDLRWLLILLIPWAVARVLSLAWFAFCYSP